MELDAIRSPGEDEQQPLQLAPVPESPPNVLSGFSPIASPLASGRTNALQTLTSGRKREIHGGALQAHICVVTGETDVAEVMAAFHEADGFRGVASWSYAVRTASPDAPGGVFEAVEDGLDEGCGEKILGVLRRCGLNGLLLVVSRWQDYGASSALEMLGTSLYSQVVERCKDLIASLKQVVGMNDDRKTSALIELPKPSGPKNFDFGFLPPLPEPRVPTKFGPNHFMSEAGLNRPQSLPNLFSGGDVRLWMENDKCLKELSEAELWALRALRQPDEKIARILQAVAVLRNQRPHRQAGNAAARWGQCREVLRSATFRTELLLFDASTVSMEIARLALQLVDGLEAEDVRRVNAGSAALLDWVRGVARWRLEGPAIEHSASGLQALHTREADLPGLAAAPVAASTTALSAPAKKRLPPAYHRHVSPLRRSHVPLIATR